MKSKIYLFSCLLFLSITANARIWYVKTTGSSTDGTSWATSVSLQYALETVVANDEIWVASGTYLPTKDPFGNASPTDPRDKTFYLKNAVKLYGGFAGTENLLSEGNFKANPTILSGDIGTPNVTTDNAYHVVISILDNNTTLIDGFIITKGNANGSGGITVESRNIGQNFAGGLYHGSSSPTLKNLVFEDNSSSGSGGAIANIGNTSVGVSNPLMSNLIFKGNQAGGSGGAIYFSFSDSRVSNSVFISNSGNLGGAAFVGTPSSPEFINCTFYDNNATFNYSEPRLAGGGAIHALNGTSTFVKNCIFNENKTFGSSTLSHCDVRVFEVAGTSFSIINSLLQLDNTASNYDQTYFSNIGTSNNLFNQNPLFLNPNNSIGVGNQWFTSDDGFMILSNSPCKNTGATGTDVSPQDIVGNNRSGNPDMGAYEYIACPSPFVNNRAYVNKIATGGNSGESWANAYTEFESALNAARNCGVTEIWVAKGTYYPQVDENFNIPSNIFQKTFKMKAGLSIYGGFVGGETAINQRNITLNETILCGDLNQNTTRDNDDALRILTWDDADNSIFDGFIIKDGYNSLTAAVNGAGLYMRNSLNATIRNTIFRNNFSFDGGGMYVVGSTFIMDNCTFENNTATDEGGGIYVIDDPRISGNITITNSKFLNNTADQGGGVYGIFSSTQSSIIENCVFKNNTGLTFGGGLYYGTSAVLTAPALTIKKTLFEHNFVQGLGQSSALHTFGGYLLVERSVFYDNVAPGKSTIRHTGGGTIVLSNCILNRNESAQTIYNDVGKMSIINSTAYDNIRTSTQKFLFTFNPQVLVLKNNIIREPVSTSPLQINPNTFTPSIENNILTGGYAGGTGNQDPDPLFVNQTDPDGVDNVFGTSDDGLHIKPCSPAVDNGGTGSEIPSTDILNNNRVDIPATGITNTDIGAFEVQSGVFTPSVIPTNSQSVCFPNTASLTATGCSGSVMWSNGATGSSITVSAVGTYLLSATCTINGCTSQASFPRSITIRAKPNSPTVTPQSQLSVCSPNTLTLTATCATGTVIWSNNATGTSLTLNAVGTYAISAECRLSNCDSDPSPTVNLEIKAKPNVPTITPPSQLAVCSPNTLTLTASCATGTVLWSDNSTGTSLTLNSVGTYAISAKCTQNGCDSDASGTTNLEIKAKPNVPTITPPSQLAVCSPNTLTLTASCASGTVLWSDNSAGTSLTLNSVGTYAISAKCVFNNCDSDPSITTNLEIKAKPNSPTITPPSQLAVCSPNTLTLTATCTTGAVLWSDSSTGTNLTLNAVGTYAISAKCVFNNCDSDPSSTTNLEIKAKPNSPTITPPSQLAVCSPNTLTLTATCTTGTVLWSDNSTGNSLTLNAVGTYAISAKCQSNGCDSDPSTTTNLEIKAKPNYPTITPPSQLAVCSPNTLTLTASCTSGTVLWSDNSTGNSLTLNAVGNYAISAKCVFNNCDSDASGTTNLEIKAKPTTPTITPPSQLAVCSPNTLTLTATCPTGTVLWSNNATGTRLTLNTVGTYAISAKCQSNACDSDASGTTNLEIKAKPNSPTITPPSQLAVCSPNTLTLTATCATGTVIWSNNATGTSLTLNAVGTYTISAKCVLNGCESDPSSTTILEIKAKPNSPTITPPSQLAVCSPNTLTLTATCTTGTVLWSDSSTGTNLTLNVVGTYAISAKCVFNNCDSDPSSTTNLEIKAKPNSPTITPPSQLAVCSPNTLTLTATCTTGTVLWSDNSTGNSLTLNAVGTYAISAKCQSNGCDSDASGTTNLEIKAKPNSPTITPPSQLSVCFPQTFTLNALGCSGTISWIINQSGLSSKPTKEEKENPSALFVGATLTLTAVGNYTISAKCTQNGCDSDLSNTITLEIQPNLVITATNSSPFAVGQSINLNTQIADSYSWIGPNNFTSNLQNPIIQYGLEVNAGIYKVTTTKGVCTATATTEVVMNLVNPCTKMVELVYVKEGNPYQPLFIIENGMKINELPHQTSILAIPICNSPMIESFNMQIQGPNLNYSILQNVSLYAIFDNSGNWVFGRNLTPGTYTFTLTGYSQDNLQGSILYGPVVTTFTIVSGSTSISTPNLTRTTLCSGSNVDVSFTKSGTFGSNNQFKIELSDADGNFSSPPVLGNITTIGAYITPKIIGISNSDGTITCTIPLSVEGGTNYRIRVISNDGVSISPISLPITIHPKDLNLVSPTDDYATNIGVKQASQRISATNKLNSPASVIYQAGKTVVLNAGFEAKAGSVFQAKIDGCN